MPVWWLPPRPPASARATQAAQADLFAAPAPESDLDSASGAEHQTPAPAPGPEGVLPPPARDPAWPESPLWGVGHLPPGPRLAIVGARGADDYGVEVARQVAQAAVEAGVVVVSGGAFGIDIAAHRGALAAGGATVVVLGNGLADPQPAPHLDDCVAVLARGCVLSPFAPDQPGARWTYPRRNPWIAALSDAVVVVQAALKSGSLQTADAALALGRPVFVVPGPMGSDLHAGCYALLARGAQLLNGPAAWRSALGLASLPGAQGAAVVGRPSAATEAGARPAARRRPGASASGVSASGASAEPPSPAALAPSAPPPFGQALWTAAGAEPQTLGDLAAAAGLDLAQAAEDALLLELEGWLRALPGGCYTRAPVPPR